MNKEHPHTSIETLRDTIVVHAPHFFPWPPMVARLALSEHIVFLDHLPFKKEYYQHRTKLAGPNGLYWAGIPIKRATKSEPIYRTEIAGNSDFLLSKTKSSIEQFYSKSPYYQVIYPRVAATIDKISSDRPKLSMSSALTIFLFFDLCGLERPNTLFSSSFSQIPTDRSEMVLHFAKELDATTVLNGFGGSMYVHDQIRLATEGVSMRFMDQSVSGNIPDGLSYLHYFFNEGPSYFIDLIARIRSGYEM